MCHTVVERKVVERCLVPEGWEPRLDRSLGWTACGALEQVVPCSPVSCAAEGCRQGSGLGPGFEPLKGGRACECWLLHSSSSLLSHPPCEPALEPGLLWVRPVFWLSCWSAPTEPDFA